MSLPPQGDPRRPLHLAARSMRVLGVLFLIGSTCLILPLVALSRAAFRISGSGTAPFPVGRALVLVAAAVFYVGPAVCYIVFPIFLLRRQFWAVVASLVRAGLHCVLALISLLMFAYAAVSSSGNVPILPAVVMLLVVAALSQLIYHLSLSFEAIKHMPADERGFAPIMTAQLVEPRPALSPSHATGGPTGDEPNTR
jgi:hypothetical protein